MLPVSFEYCSLSKRFVTNGASVGSNVIVRLFVSYNMRYVGKIFPASSETIRRTVRFSFE